MSRRARPPEFEEPDLELTPMIDIVFNLLIFFLCATTFIVPEGMIDAFLPRAEGGGPGPTDTPLERPRIKLLRVGEATVVKLGQEALNRPGELERAEFSSKAPVWALLQERLQALIVLHRTRQPGKQMPVILDVRQEVPTKHAVSALNEVVRAGLKEVTFARPEQPYD